MSLSSNYNSRPRAAEVLVEGKKAQLIRRRETMRDLIRAGDPALAKPKPGWWLLCRVCPSPPPMPRSTAPLEFVIPRS